MANPFSAHEFFIEDGTPFIVAVEAHNYNADGVEDGSLPGKELKNARVRIGAKDGSFELEASIPKAALVQLIRLSQKYLKSGKGDHFISPGA